MTLFGLSTATIRPTALVLNILVALIGSFQFWRAGHFSWKLFSWPFALLSVPAAYFGGLSPVTSSSSENHYSDWCCSSPLPDCFFVAAIPRRSLHPPCPPHSRSVQASVFSPGRPAPVEEFFLTPLLLFSNWAKTKQASAVSALFILVNSIAGLAVLLAPDNPFRYWPSFFPPPRSLPVQLVRIWEAASFRFAPFRFCSPPFLLSPALN